MDFNVRPATVDDCSVMATQWKEAYRDFLEATPGDFGGPLRAPDAGTWHLAYLRQLLEDPDRIALVAEAGGAVVGFIRGEIKRETDDLYEAPYLTVGHLSVERTARRTGVGRALMERLEMIARERGMKAMDLEVLVRSAPAVRLYESLGFTPLTERMAKLLGD